jgi:hypothetical protein
VLKLFAAEGEVQKNAIENQKRGESRALHDLKHLVTALVRVVESNDVRVATERFAPATTANVEIMKSTITSVFHILGAIKNQVEMADYILAPEASEFVASRDIDVYPLFEKNVRIYNLLAEMQGKTIVMSRPLRFVSGHRILRENFVLIPAILLQNAIKYSLDNTTTTVEVTESREKLRIVVKSTGAIIPPSERQRIWKMGEQYVHRNDTSKGGSGFGLFLAKSICDATGFAISYEGLRTGERNGGPVGENQFILSEK